MPYFSDFQWEELSLILSIPYRAGVYLSHADDVPGCDRDDTKEQLVLEKTLKKLRSKVDNKTLAAGVLDDILNHKDHWPAWGASADSVLSDVPRAVRLIHDRLPDSELTLYRKCVFSVAKAVAMAANEQDGMQDSFSDIPGGGLLRKFRDWMETRNVENMPENISKAEKVALQKLQSALKG